MKYLKFAPLILATCLLSCSGNKEKKVSEIRTDTISSMVQINTPVGQDKNEADKEEIETLIRAMLNWSWSEKNHNFDLTPALADSKDSTYTGFDLSKLKVNLDQLKKTNFFSAEFIENYNQIILTLDRKVKNKEFGKWSTGELPPFAFANDVAPWCNCQDVPYDKPNPWSFVETEVIKLTSENGELNWKWGKPELNTAPGWKEFRYKFKVKKENGKWKISYLQGFDLKESIKNG